MDASIYTLDANGYADVGAASGAYGFRITPEGSSPGPMPVAVYIDQVNSPKRISDGAGYYLRKPMHRLEIKGGTPGATYNIVTLDQGEKVGPGSGAKKPSRVAVYTNQALAAAAPVGAVGVAIPETWVGGLFRLYVLDLVNDRTIRKWLKTNGVWVPAQNLDQTSHTDDVVREMQILAGVDALYLQINDANGALNVNLDVEIPA